MFNIYKTGDKTLNHIINFNYTKKLSKALEKVVTNYYFRKSNC